MIPSTWRSGGCHSCDSKNRAHRKYMNSPRSGSAEFFFFPQLQGAVTEFRGCRSIPRPHRAKGIRPSYFLSSRFLRSAPSPPRKHGALRSQKPLKLIRDGEIEGSGIFIPNTYSLHCHHQTDSALTWAAVEAILIFHYCVGKVTRQCP